MNRPSRITIGRLSPRATVISGAALGLIAGVTVYGAVSSSAQSPKPFTATTSARPAVAAAPVHYASCAKGAKLEKGFCVTHVVKMVLATPTASASARAAAPVAGTRPAATVKPAPTPAKVVSPAAAPAPLPAAPVAKATAAPSAAPTPAPKPTGTAKPTATPVPSAAS